MFARRVGSVSACLSAVVALVVALVYPGVDVTEVDLHDGGVWVTNSSMRLVGHLNYPARQLDGGLRAGSDVFDVFQSGEDVAVFDAEESSLARVDVSRIVLERGVSFEGMSVEVSAGVVGILDGVTGRGWVLDEAEVESFKPELKTPDFEGLLGGVMTVGLDGTVHVVSTQAGRGVSVGRDNTGLQVRQWPLEGVSPEESVQISAVGPTPVVLDREAGRLYVNGTSQLVEGEGLTLQESGPEAESVLVASQKDLIEVPLGGGEVKAFSAPAVGGSAARPVRVGACIYGAWSGSGAFVRDCADGSPVSMQVESLSRAEQVVFRVNRDVVVLNDVKSGGLWLPNEQMLFVDNWDQIESEVKSQEETTEDSVDENEQTALPQRSEENTVPVATDDDFGVRVGRRSILPVLLNDSDADGDVLTARVVSEPSWGSVGIARDGAALWMDVPTDAAGSTSFEYEVADGRGGVASARVNVSVRGDEVNEAPRQVVRQSVSVGVGRRAVAHVLGDWFDPDGDPFYLDGATGPAGLNIRTQVNGTVALEESGHGAGQAEVELMVSDGRDVGRGVMPVTIRGGGNEAPIANADHVVVSLGAQVSVAPLENDSDPNGDLLRLMQVDSVTGVTVTADTTAGMVFVQGDKLGSYYLNYSITDGPTTTMGVIRVDVVEPSNDAPLSVEPDLGVLSEGGQALVDVLANDSDPSGGVLTVQSVDVPADSPLVVALVGHQLVRVSAPAGLSAPAEFSYTVSSGRSQATSSVKILPRTTDIDQRPEAVDDQLVVRVGDVGGVAVLENDRSPMGLRLEVSDQIQHEIAEDVGKVFVSNNVIRVRGGSRAGSGRIVYTVVDAAGNVASAAVNVVVVEMDAERNTAPHARDVVARTVAGRPIDIVIPLDNIDPEGDSVSLVGVASAPQLGTVEVTGNKLRYTPGQEAAGTDSFTYEVEDRLGKRAVGTVRVGVAPAAKVNQNPVAVPDQVMLRPGARVAVSVLANDIDSDGDALVLAEGTVKSADGGVKVFQRGKKVIVEAPQAEGTYGISYGVTDRVGGFGHGLLTVVVDAEAPTLAPIARDDQVGVDEVQQAIRQSRQRISIDVLANDEDPDGDIDTVAISSPDAAVKVEASRLVSVELTPEPQVLIYTLTDADNKTASAVIRVPGVAVKRPVLDLSTVPVRIQAGQSRDIAINDHLITANDSDVVVTDAAGVRASQGSDGTPVVKDPRTITFTALPDFSGPATVTFPVGPEGGTQGTETTLITLPVEIYGAPNRAPVLRPTGITLAPGQAPQTIDLTQMVTDPDGDNPASMTYALGGQLPAEINASISGSTLTISAAAGTSVGVKLPVELNVTDPRGASVQGAIPLTVVATTVPPIQISPASLTLAPGQTARVDLASYATNPALEGGALSLVGTPTAPEGLSLTSAGTTLTVSALDGFTGTSVVAFTLTDTVNDPARHALGTLTVNVQGPPKAPANVTAAAQGPRTAQLSWTPPASNGSPITHYTVTDHVQGDSITCAPSTTCLLPNRTPDVEHTFTVTATNSAGQSAPSSPVTLTLDLAPDTPSAPVLQAQDRQIIATWQPANTQGSAIIDYEITLNPGGLTQNIPATNGQLRTTFTSVANGTQYTATVRARNARGYSQPSPASLPVTPIGRPGPVQNLQAAVVGKSPADSNKLQVSITWAPPANLTPAERGTYWMSLAPLQPGQAPENAISQQTFSLDGSTTSYVTDLPISNTSTVITLWMLNDAQTDNTGAARAHVVVDTSAPAVPAAMISRAFATGEGNAVQIEWNMPNYDPFWNAYNMTLEWSTGATWEPLTKTGLVRGNGLQNGKESFVRIRSAFNVNGELRYAEPSDAVSVIPYTALPQPSVRCDRNMAQPGQATCVWALDNPNPNILVTGSIRWGTDPNAAPLPVLESGSQVVTVDPTVTSQFCYWAKLSLPGMEGTPGELRDWVCTSIEPWPQAPQPKVVVAYEKPMVTLTVSNYDMPGEKNVRCLGISGMQAGVVVGSASVEIPENGTVQFRCETQAGGLSPDQYEFDGVSFDERTFGQY